jgi:hypothetical protein
VPNSTKWEGLTIPVAQHCVRQQQIVYNLDAVGTNLEKSLKLMRLKEKLRSGAIKIRKPR